MGKKDKFIDKANSQKFHLLHRSLTDEAHSKYEVPSTFVLVPAVETGTNAQKGRSSKSGSGTSIKLSATKDHINELGFANDGYDYSQHLREIGGGTFISKSGQPGTALDLSLLSRKNGPAVELPEDCMPSENSLDRHFEAITINHNLMDKDIRAALFDGFDEEGEFEELQDDFIEQAMNGPEDDDFDFDAHIAKLIARSEQTLGIANPEARNRVRFAGDDGEELLGDSDDEFPDYLVPEADMQQYQKQMKRGASRGRRGDQEDGGDEVEEELVGGRGAAKGAVHALSEVEREALEAQFERALEEYDDEEIGYLDELQEEDIGGNIDFTEDGNVLESVLDEFLQAQKDLVFAEGTNVHKGLRSSIVDPKKPAEQAEDEVAPEQVDPHKELLEQQALQEETELELLRMKQEAQNKDTSIETCQAYLQEVRIDEEWDCETILSTYSTLDNHPTLIKDKNAKFKKYKSPHQRSLEAAAAASAGGMSSAGSVASRSVASRSKAGSSSNIYGTSAALTAKTPSSVPSKIVLSGKLNLPEGFGPTAYEKRKDLPQRSLDSAGPSKGKLVDIAEAEEQSESDSGSDSGSGSGSDGEGSGNENGSRDVRKKSRSMARKRRQETAEEKKARKEAVKAERRAKRAGKKELRTAFKAEGAKMIRSVGNEQSTDHVSVFRYT